MYIGQEKEEKQIREKQKEYIKGPIEDAVKNILDDNKNIYPNFIKEYA